jgi:hypothetical protein
VPHVVVAGGRAASEDDGVPIHVGTVDDAVAQPTILGEDHVAACPRRKAGLRCSGPAMTSPTNGFALHEFVP